MLRELIDWASNQASELNTSDQYRQYCIQKAEKLNRQSITRLSLPAATGAATNQPTESFLYIPGRDVLRKSWQGQSEQRYPVIDRALRAENGVTHANSLRDLLKNTLRPETGEAKKSAPETAVLFADIHTGYPDQKILLDGATLLLQSGSLIEIGGGVSTPILQAMAEQRKSSQGTTYIRTREKDINVHLDNDRSEISYYNCNKKENYGFFAKLPPEEALNTIRQSGLFDKSEINRMEQMVARHAPINGLSISRSCEKRLALVEALAGDQTVVILNYPFEDLNNEAEVIQATKFLEAAAQRRVIVIRSDKAKKPLYQRNARVESYDIVDGQFVRAKPEIAEVIQQLEQLGVEIISKWDEKFKARLAQEIVDGIAKVSVVEGQLVRETQSIQVAVTTVAPDGTRYRLKHIFKVEDDENGDPVKKPGSKGKYSIIRSIQDNNPERTLLRRLKEMKLIPEEGELGQVVFKERSETEESRTYHLSTHRNLFETDVEIPWPFAGEKPIPCTAKHDSGGYSFYGWRKI